MAVLAFYAAGSMIGGAIGGTFLGVTAAAWGGMIGSMVGNAILKPKGPDQHSEGPQYSDAKVMLSAYGRSIPKVWGAYPVMGNVIWKTPLRKVAHTESQEVGKGGILGGGQTVSNTTYEHFVNVAILLCEGPIIGVSEIKFNGSLKYNVDASAASEDVIASALNARAVRVYLGDETQEIDGLIASYEGANASAMRGYAYMVLEDLEVSEYGGQVPQIDAKVVAHGTRATTLAITAGTTVGATDVINSAPGFVLGRGGNVWGLGAVSNTAVRVNYYAGSVQSVYTRTLYGYIPTDLSPDDEAIFNNYGGYFGILHDDGTVTEYTSAPGIFGSQRIAWLDDHSGFALGDSVSGFNFYRFTLNDATDTVDETQLTAARVSQVFINATGIEGRCYVYGDNTYNHEIGYITDTNSQVLLFSGNDYHAPSLLVSRDGYLWMGREGASKVIEKRDRDGTLIASVTLPGSAQSSGLFEAPDGYIWTYASNSIMYGIHPSLYTIDFTSVATGTRVPLGFTEDGRFLFYSISGADVLMHEMEPIPRITPATVAASEIVSEIAAMVQLEAADLNIATLTDAIHGYGIFRRMPARSGLEPVLAFCRAEMVESDDKLKAVKRTGTVVATIDADDLGAHEFGESAPSAYTTRRLNEAVLPWELVVEYPDIDAGYEVNVQPARRWTVESEQTELIPIPLAMSAQDAMRLAETAIDDRWVSRMVYGLRLPRAYARLEPTDVIRVPGIDPALRIVSAHSARGIVELECVADSDATYASTATGASAPAGPTSVNQAGPTLLRLLDIPLLLDSHDAPGFYVAACGYFSGWSGAELWVSSDNGTSYSRIDTALLNAATIGSTTTTLGNWTGGDVHDETNYVDVQLIAGTLPSSGACLIGSELLEYQAASLIATRKYRLSSLRRGRKGTNAYIGTHTTGENFVLLTTSSIYRITTASSEIGAPRLYKAVSFGQAVAEASPVSFTLAGVGLECYAAVNLRAGRTANASWDITIDWDRRTRVGGEWRNNVDASLGEASQSYEVEIYDSSFTTLKRTLTGLSSSSATYTSAQQVTDFGSNQATVYVRIYQLSASVGRGFAAQGSLGV